MLFFISTLKWNHRINQISFILWWNQLKVINYLEICWLLERKNAIKFEILSINCDTVKGNVIVIFVVSHVIYFAYSKVYTLLFSIILLVNSYFITSFSL